MDKAKRLPLVFVVASFALAGCGSFPLGTAYPSGGQTRDELQMAVLVCKDRAKNEANTDARVAASFVAGLTIVGAPIAMAEERRKQREVWAECMTQKGYRVVPPDDAPKQVSTTLPTQPASVATAAPKASVIRDEASAQLERIKSMRERGLITEEDYNTKKKEILDRL